MRNPDPAMYLPTSWYLWESMVVVLRTATDPEALAPAIRRIVTLVDPDQAAFDIRSMRSVIAASGAEPRVSR